MYPRRVALFMHGIEAGVFTRLGTALIRGFKEAGINDCDLVVLNATDEEKSWYPDINIVSLDVKHATYSLFPLVSYFRNHQPDVIFPMPWYFNVIAIWARMLAGTDTKIIMTEHNVISLEASIEHRAKLKLRYLPLIMRYSYPFGHGLIGVSQDVITDLLQKIKISPRIPMIAIPTTVDVERVQRLAQEPVNHPWLEDDNVAVILTAARLAKQKQLDILLRAFSQAVKTSTHLRLLILGEGSLRLELENLCKELKIDEYVSMPGYVSNPYGYMANCDAFVLTSAWEGCPVALGEAMACGAAVIVNDAPGGSKDMVDYGKYGLMVPTGDIEALSTAILKVVSNPDVKEHYRKQGHSRAQDFKYSKISNQYLDFYQTVVVSSKDSYKGRSISM